MEYEKRPLKSESITGKSSEDSRNKIAAELTYLGVLTIAEVTENFEFSMAEIQDKIKGKVVETVAKALEKGILKSYSD